MNAEDVDRRVRDADDALWPPGDPAQVVGDDLDDLAESQRDNGEVVASQPKRWSAEDDSGDHRRRDRKRDRPKRVDVERGMNGKSPRPVRRRVRADCEEGDVAEVEKAGESDDDVEAERQQDVEPDLINEDLLPERVEVERQHDGAREEGEVDGSAHPPVRQQPARERKDAVVSRLDPAAITE